MAGGEALGKLRKLLDVRSQLLCPERAIEADGERARMTHGVVERLGRLARERASGSVGDRAGDDDWQSRAVTLESLVDGEERRLGIERVEDRLDQQQIGA